VTFRWVWRDGSSEEFDTRQAAEDWLKVGWEALLESGVLVIELRDDDDRVYEMKLTED
jgi:hypothetical protein